VDLALCGKKVKKKGKGKDIPVTGHYIKIPQMFKFVTAAFNLIIGAPF
jgi:hypothetical protein